MNVVTAGMNTIVMPETTRRLSGNVTFRNTLVLFAPRSSAASIRFCRSFSAPSIWAAPWKEIVDHAENHRKIGIKQIQPRQAQCPQEGVDHALVVQQCLHPHVLSRKFIHMGRTKRTVVLFLLMSLPASIIDTGYPIRMQTPVLISASNTDLHKLSDTWLITLMKYPA